MAVAVKVVLNSAGIKRLLKSQGVLDKVNAEARKIAQHVHVGRAVVTEIGPNRSRAAIIAYDESGDVDAVAEDLLRAIDMAGGDEGG